MRKAKQLMHQRSDFLPAILFFRPLTYTTHRFPSSSLFPPDCHCNGHSLSTKMSPSASLISYGALVSFFSTFSSIAVPLFLLFDLPTALSQPQATTVIEFRASLSHKARILAGNASPNYAAVKEVGSYFMNISIGTPPAVYSGVADTGSDPTWMPCTPAAHQGPFPAYDPKKSSTSANVSCAAPLCLPFYYSNCTTSDNAAACGYALHYGDGSTSQGYLASDAFELSTSKPTVAFGCGLDNHGRGMDTGEGVVGLGRGPLSLFTQLRVKKFAYCLSSYAGSKPGVLLVGPEAVRSGAGIGPKEKRTTSTPLVQNPVLNPTSYYLALEGITVGSTRLAIDKSIFQLTQEEGKGNGGVIMDTGTTFTSLTNDAYVKAKEAFEQAFAEQMLEIKDQSRRPDASNRMGNPRGLDLCVKLGEKKAAEVKIPELTFHLKGLDWNPARENYIGKDDETNTLCLMMVALADPTRPSVLGSTLQQNWLMALNLEENSLSITPARCDRL